MTLADHAEAWAKSLGKAIPPRDSDEWKALYAEWHAWAFSEFAK